MRLSCIIIIHYTPGQQFVSRDSVNRRDNSQIIYVNCGRTHDCLPSCRRIKQTEQLSESLLSRYIA